MSRQVSQRLQHSGRVDMVYIADPTTNAVFGTVDPFPIEIAEQSLDVTISGYTFDGSGNLKVINSSAIEISGFTFDGSSNLKMVGTVEVSGSTFSTDGTVSGSNLYTTTRAIDSGINYSGNVTALSNYTSSAELVYEPDVGMFARSTNNGILQFQFSPDNSNWSSFPVNGFDMTANVWEFHTAVKLPRWFRYNFDNCGATDCSLEAYVYYGQQLRQGNLPLSQTIGADNDAIVVRSVGVGRQPDGDYVNIPADGNAFSTSVSLGADASYQSAWVDTDGYNTIEIYASSDVPSATNGLLLEFTDDAAVGNVEFLRGYTYSATDVTNGYKLFTIPTALDGYRVTYTNGSTAQGSFYLSSTLKVNGIKETEKLDTAITDDREASTVRAIQVGKDPTDMYVNTRQDGYVLYIDGSTNLPYQSAVLDTLGYTQIQTELYCDVSGTLTGKWYSDSAQTTLMRTFTFPYNTGRGLEVFGAPIFARYLTYAFTTSASANSFVLGLKLLTKAISGQVLGATSTIVEGMVANLGRNILVGQDKALNFKNMPIDVEGHLQVHVHDPTTAFGQVKVSEETPIIEQYFPYGLLTDEVNTYKLQTSVTASGGTGTGLKIDYDASSTGIVQYVFPTRSNIGSNYVLGDVVTISAGGLNSTAIVRSVTSSGGVLALDICAAGTGYTASPGQTSDTDGIITLTASGANNKVVVETKRRIKYHTGTGVVTRYTAIFEPSAGTYQFVGPADGNNGFLTGCIDTSFCVVRRRNGVDNITYQNNFNVDTLNGVAGLGNPSNLNVNFTKGNVYQTKFQWLGFGAVKFSIEDPNGGSIEPYHIIQYAGSNTDVTVVSPSYPIRWEVGNTTNTSNIRLKSASAMGSVEGKRLYPNRLYRESATSLSLVLQNQKYFKNKVNKAEVYLNSIIIANQTTNTDLTFTIYKATSNPTTSTYATPNANSVVSRAKPAAGFTPSSGDIIGLYILNKGTSQNIKFTQYELDLLPTEYIVIVPSGTPSSVTATWHENK